MSEIVPASAASPIPVRVDADLVRFEEMLLAQIAAVGLPTDGVLVEVSERKRMLSNVDGALENLPPSDRGRSIYVSKMIAASAAGLFDAALNYLWNETVGELRRRIAGYDLGYFFDIAVTSHDRRKHLSTEEDLAKVDDVDLLRAAREIGLISDNGHAQLDHIRYMRNYASAAHPNQVQITGLQLATWLETCIRQVITLPYDTITAEIGRLLRNIKADSLSPSDVPGTTAFFDDLPDDRADKLAGGLFGLYTDPARTPIVADNVRLLWPALWPYVGEEARQTFGVKYGRFRASADLDQARAAREILDLVDATSYLPEKERVAEIDAALDALLAAHHGFNNFNTEPAPARGLATLVGERGDVPSAVAAKYVRTLVEVFLGNSYGISWAADPTYRQLLGLFDSSQAATALRAFLDLTVSAHLASSVGRKQWDELLSIVEPKLTAARDRQLLDAVRAFTGEPHQLRKDSGIIELAGAKRPSSRRPAKTS